MSEMEEFKIELEKLIQNVQKFQLNEGAIKNDN